MKSGAVGSGGDGDVDGIIVVGAFGVPSRDVEVNCGPRPVEGKEIVGAAGSGVGVLRED